MTMISFVSQKAFSVFMPSTALRQFFLLKHCLSRSKKISSVSTWLQIIPVKTFSINKKSQLPSLDFFQLHKVQKNSCLEFRFSRRLSHNEPDWENLLSSEKKNNIKDIPVKKENIYTIPNLLSLMRIVVTPYLGYLIIHQQFSLALCISIFAALSDLADGYIARKWPSQQSALGSALDPLADKIFISVLAFSLSYANIMPVLLTSLFIARDVLLIGAVFYLRYRTCPPPVTLKRYFDPTLVNAKLNPTKVSKMNTVLQVAVIWMSLASPVFNFTDHVLLKSLWCLSATTTVLSGFSYLKKKDTVRILKDK